VPAHLRGGARSRRRGADESEHALAVPATTGRGTAGQPDPNGAKDQINEALRKNGVPIDVDEKDTKVRIFAE
jgi:hypothetical protein